MNENDKTEITKRIVDALKKTKEAIVDYKRIHKAHFS